MMSSCTFTGAAFDRVGLGAHHSRAGVPLVERSLSTPERSARRIDSSWRRCQLGAVIFSIEAMAGDAARPSPDPHPLHRQRKAAASISSSAIFARSIGSSRRRCRPGRSSRPRPGSSDGHVADGADHGALVGQQGLRHVRAPVQRADQVLLLHAHVVEEGLAEGGLSGRSARSAWSTRRAWPCRTARRKMPRCSAPRVGADQAEIQFGLVRRGGPDLLP